MDKLTSQEQYIQNRQDEIIGLVNSGDAYTALERCQIVVRKMKKQDKLEDALIFLMKIAINLAYRGEWHPASVCALRSISQFPSQSKKIRVVLKQLYFQFADSATAEAVCPELFNFYELLSTFFHDQRERLLIKQAFLSDSANAFYTAQNFYIELLGKNFLDYQTAPNSSSSSNANNTNTNNNSNDNNNSNNINDNNNNNDNNNTNETNINEEVNANTENNSQNQPQITPEQQKQKEKINELLALLAPLLWRWVLSQEGADNQIGLSQYIFSRCVLHVLSHKPEIAVQTAKKLLALIKSTVPTEVSTDSEKIFNLPMFRFVEFYVKAIDRKSVETADFLIKKYEPAISIDADLIDTITAVKENHITRIGGAGFGGLGAMLQNIFGGMFGGQGA